MMCFDHDDDHKYFQIEGCLPLLTASQLGSKALNTALPLDEH